MTNPSQTPELLKGIDVSKWQGDPDWQRVKDAGYAWAIVKLSQGLKLDPKAMANIAGCQAVEMPFAVYCYLDSEVDAVAQARYFVDHLPEGITPVLDIESGDDAPRRAFAWIDVVEPVRKPLVYTNPDFAETRGFAAHKRFAEYDLWIAHYGAVKPRIPKPWTRYVAWQTGQAKVPGIAGQCDVNVSWGMPF